MNLCIRKKKMISLLLGFIMMFLSLGNVMTSMAATTNYQHTTHNGLVDFSRGNASISISGDNATKSLLGKKFQIYPLFHVENAVGMESVNYTFYESTKSALQNAVGNKLNIIPTNVTEYEVIDYIQSLNSNAVQGADAQQKEEAYNSDFRYFVEELRNELKNLNVSGDIVYVADESSTGTIVLQGLEYGYYLIDEVSENEGTHSASSLCMVNTANPDSAIKVKSDYPSVTIKIQEDDEKEKIGNDGWNDMADYEIGQTVPYKVESIISDLNGYETYFYAWHHKVDEALTFDPKSVQISISNDTKSYDLSATQFTVKENVNEDSFVISIADLKAIVNHEFPLKDEMGHHIYGQKITLTYSAVIGERGASRTGVNGFENQVRLEYSNDPDQDGKEKTGYTPWDTVVCFTYGLNGLKTNDKDLKLKDAKFRLYLDEACSKEVHVKSVDTKYVVVSEDAYNKTKDSEYDCMIQSDADGKFLISGLDSGTYYLKEIKAPEGYRLLLDPIRIRIETSFVSDRNNYQKGDGVNKKALTEIKFFAHIKEFLNGASKENETELNVNLEQGTGNLTVVNTVGSKLPITGSIATLIMIGSGVVLMIIPIIFTKRKMMNDK